MADIHEVLQAVNTSFDFDSAQVEEVKLQK